MYPWSQSRPDHLFIFTSVHSFLTYLHSIAINCIGKKFSRVTGSGSCPMYNGVGILTPRGTGTNGHVMTNLSRPKSLGKKNQYDWRSDSGAKPALPKANFDLLEHGTWLLAVCSLDQTGRERLKYSSLRGLKRQASWTMRRVSFCLSFWHF